MALRIAIRSNPILASEMRQIFGRRFALAQLLLFAGAAALAVYVAWPREVKLLMHRDRVSAMALDMLGGALRGLALLIGPAYAALSVTRDRDRGALEWICSTPLGPKKIFQAKFLASAAFLWMLILSTAPVAAVVYLLGGLEWWKLAATYAELLLAAGAISAHGVCCSARMRTSGGALALAYGQALPIGALWMAFPDYHAVWLIAAAAAWAFCANHAPTLRRLTYPSGRAPIFDQGHFEESDEEEARPNPLTRIFVPFRLPGPMRDWQNPVLVRELRWESLGGGAWILNFAALALAASAASAVWHILARAQPALWALVAIGAAAIAALALSAPAMAREFDQRTFESMAATPLRPFSILWGKAWIAIRTSFILLALETVPAAAAMAFSDRGMFDALPALGLVAAATIILLSVVGLFCSFLARSASQALVNAFAAAALPFVGGPAFCRLLWMYSDLEPSRYSWLALLSPATPLLAMAGSPWLKEGALGHPLAPERYIGIFCALSAGLALALFIVMAAGFDYFWKKGPLKKL